MNPLLERQFLPQWHHSLCMVHVKLKRSLSIIDIIQDIKLVTYDMYFGFCRFLTRTNILCKERKFIVFKTFLPWETIVFGTLYIGNRSSYEWLVDFIISNWDVYEWLVNFKNHMTLVSYNLYSILIPLVLTLYKTRLYLVSSYSQSHSHDKIY